MVNRQLHVAVLACGLVAVYAYAADTDSKGKGREETRANATHKSAGPTRDTHQSLKPPLQTGEVKVPEGGVDTSTFDPNAGGGFKGKSTPGGGTIQPRSGADASKGSNATGATSGGSPTGATAPKGPRDAGGRTEARGERGSGKTETHSGGTRTGAGAGSAGSGSK
ncbi:MAG: hypothetical protein ACM3SS_07130 [Rhodospirillaceae bacterium]